MKNKFIAYLHSCGLSQGELRTIFEEINCPEQFFLTLSYASLEKYVKNLERREIIVANYKKINTRHIDAILVDFWVSIIVLGDDDYPQNLKNIPHTPYILYVRWKLPQWDMFWVVGSRKISEYGKKVIHNIVPEISKIFPIVSGGAAGCDTFAHKSCMDAWNQTVVVVGTWIDKTYPVSNEKLFERVIASSGAIVSIFRIWEPWNPYNFPVRNEVVVWLSRWVLVIEAKEKSWSLITAWLSLDLGKDLFSVPGDILSVFYTGTNNLIKRWEAKCVMGPGDILEEYNMIVKKTNHKHIIKFWDELEQKIYGLLSENSQNIDELSLGLEIQPRDLLVKVSILELKWVVKKDLLWKYQLA